MCNSSKLWLQPSISACNVEYDLNEQYCYAEECVLDEPYVLICSDSTLAEDDLLNLSDTELSSYKLTRLSGVLDFWDEESENLYSFDDGKPL